MNTAMRALRLFLLLSFTLLRTAETTAQYPLSPFTADPFGIFKDSLHPPQKNRGILRNQSPPGDQSNIYLRLQTAQSRGNDMAAGHASGVIASGLMNRGEADSAAFYYSMSQRHFQNAGIARGEAAALIGLGQLADKRNDERSALQYFEEAYRLFNSANDKRSANMTLAFIGKVYEDLDDHTSSLKTFQDVLKNSDKSNNRLQAALNNKVAEEFIHLNRNREAGPYLEEALRCFQLANDKKGEAVVLRNMAALQYKQGSFRQAAQTLEKSLNKDVRLPSLRLLRDTYLRLFAESRVKNDSLAANYFSTLYYRYKDTVELLLNSRALSPDSFTAELEEKAYVSRLLNQPKELLINRLSAQQLEFSQKLTEAELERLKSEEAIARLNQERMEDEVANQERDSKIQQLEHDKAIQELALSEKALQEARQRHFIYLLLGLCALVVTSIIFLYLRFRYSRKSHAMLERAYNELKETHRKLKSTQEQLVHAEKMASLGQMTAGIAHEIQNPLNFVNNFAESTLELTHDLIETPDQEERRELANEISGNLKRILHHGQRADGIVKNMLLHSRDGNAEKQPVNLNKLCEEYAALAFHGMRAKDPEFHCRIEQQLDPELPAVPVIIHDISRVLLNLFNNAFCSIRERARTQNENFRGQVTITTIKMTSFAMLSIRDNGIGIREDIREKIYQPFFTTKPTGEGTGLGLSISFDIIKAHGGEIRCESNEGEGATFTLLLPLA